MGDVRRIEYLSWTHLTFAHILCHMLTKMTSESPWQSLQKGGLACLALNFKCVSISTRCLSSSVVQSCRRSCASASKGQGWLFDKTYPTVSIALLNNWFVEISHFSLQLFVVAAVLNFYYALTNITNIFLHGAYQVIITFIFLWRK